MSRLVVVVVIGALILLELFGASSCKHFPVEVIPDPDPIDTTINPPPPPDDTLGMPCDTNVVYFEQQILPILISNCAISGCHNVDSHQENVVLVSYESIMNTADVEPFLPGESKLYKVLIEDNPDKQMPQPPVQPLSAAQINLIATWILQGAQNLSCDPDAAGCDTTHVTFTGYVFPVIQSYCLGCHGSVSPVGGFSLNTYEAVKDVALSGKLYGAIAHQQGFSPMPQGGNPLSDCRIQKINAWIDAGALNN
ncbi:MAG: hypothetical protein IPJ40_06765 [Saprospirales bacterium]|nr:hypothetical protein [Saprospirales bacterium]